MDEKQLEKITNQYIQNPVTMKIERVAAYVRVSTQEQKLHGLSLDAQKMKLTEYAEKNNMKIVGWYVDEGVSGRKLIRKRPELQRMILDAQKGKFDRIIFIKLDRFFRSVAEYHECMKQIAPVLWSTTEEQYDLTTANGRMLVNMKLTIAEMEADQTGERIDITNEYKVSTGQPLSGSMPFGWKIETNPETGRKKIVKDSEVSDVMDDLLQHFLTFQSKHKTLVFIKTKHNVSMNYRSLSNLLRNPFLCGEYRGNLNYCEAYIDRVSYDKIQEILDRNIKHTTKRTYIFSGLIKCPQCGSLLKGASFVKRNIDGIRTDLKKYRCSKYKLDHQCDFVKVVNEVIIERKLLENIGKYLEDAKIRAAEVKDADVIKIPQHDLDDLYSQLDRLNYSWQTGKIRKVEQYEKQYEILMEKIEEGESEKKEISTKDFSKIEEILHDGWKGIYNALDDEHKRAFWRSFVQSIEINWTTEKKEITKVNFF